ncbi:MAG TPA: DegV family protein [Acidimicrobiales bacterium]|nr:DegV family protein [Acidimicrobiales bacterium]
MANVKVVTDSASDLPEDLARAYGIEVVPLTIRFGDEEFTDREDLSPEEFWARCATSPTLPETAAPSPGRFQDAFHRAAAEGHDGVVALTLSSALSATHGSATIAAEAVAGELEVRVVDTLTVAMGQGLVAIEVAERARAGAGVDELVALAHDAMARAGVVATLATLEHLIRGGRVGGAKALLGQVLSIKPLLALRDGVVAEAGRVRTRARALAACAERARAAAPLARLALIQGACAPEDVAAMRALVADIALAHPMLEAEIGPVVGTHAGPGIIGLTWLQA